jgi:hypothetical protein
MGYIAGRALVPFSGKRVRVTRPEHGGCTGAARKMRRVKAPVSDDADIQYTGFGRI